MLPLSHGYEPRVSTILTSPPFLRFLSGSEISMRFPLSINIISYFFIFFNMFAAQLALFASFSGCSRLCLYLINSAILKSFSHRD